ncbi:Dolichyl-diphosphooligosaccharide--protein glycosyltransferase subunit 1A, partial [Choanephora cucurbitarum]
MRSVHFILFALSCLCSLVWAFPTQFENTKVVRVIEINTGIAREDIGVRAKNVDTKPATDYYFYLPHIVTQNAASISAFLRKQKTPLDVALQQADDDVNVYKVTLNEAIQPQQDLLLGIKVTYTHIVKPMPAKLPQVAKQHTVYAFNSYFLSPYLSKEVKTTLQTPTKGIVGHTGAENKSNAKDNKIVYGPYVDVPPRSFQLATAHFENTKPMITVTQLERDIQVSHWGNKLSVEEHYAVRNDGAQLDSDFNRVKYMMSQPIHEQTNVWKGLSYQLPQDAHDPYYRDEVGNVSTSRFRVEPT